MFPKSLRPLLPYLKKYHRSYVWGGMFVLFMNAAWVLVPPIVGRAIDDMRQAGISLHKIGMLALVLLLVSGTKAIFQFLIRWILIGVSREVEFDLRNDLFKHLEGLSHSFYQRTRTGDIMAKATNDLNAVRMLLGPGFMYTANTIVFTAFALGFMLHISYRLTFYAFLPLPVVSVVIQYFGRKIHERFERIQAMFSEISAQAQENFSGARLVRAFAQEEPQIASFEAANRENVRRGLRLVQLMGMLWPTLEFILGLSLAITLLVGGHEVLTHRISVGQFVAFNTYMMMLTWPVIALGWVVNLVQRGTASVIRIHELMTDKPAIDDAAADPAVRPDTRLQGKIEFRHLTFAYTDTEGKPVEVLHDINLEIPAGTSLALVGPTGSGKSTLVGLIARLYEAEAGSVLIDDRPVRDYPLTTLRANIGFVPQETFLFSESIRENIAFGAPHASNDDVLA